MTTGRAVAMLTSALVAWIATGCSERVTTACDRACDRAHLCGLLPSSLGGGSREESLDNCKQRCSLSDDAANGPRASVIECFEANSEDWTAELDWCDPSSRCAAAAGCLRGRLPGSTLGQAGVNVKVMAPSGACNSGQSSDECQTSCMTNIACEPAACSTDCLSGDIDAYCSSFGVARMSVFVQRGAERESVRSLTCVDGLRTALAFGNLTPGLVRVGVQLEGSEAIDAAVDAGAPDEDAGSDEPPAALTQGFCRSILSEPLLIQAGQRAHARVALQPFGTCGNYADCENTDAMCADGMDNDADGFADCSDLDCPCAHIELCGDGKDNDGDGAQDCADPDCADMGVCRAVSNPVMTSNTNRDGAPDAGP